MGFVGLPVSLFPYWVVLRPKKEAPFPKGGLIHTCCNTLVQVPYVSYGIVASCFITACVAVYYLLQWQRSKMLDIPVVLSAAAPAPATSGVAAQASVGAAAQYRASSQPKHAQASPTMKGLDEHEFITYPRRFNGYSWFKLPAVGILVQIVLFTVVHPYNVIGMVDIALSALLYMLCCIVTKGIEAPTALHIVNNMTEIWMTGFGFGVITSETTVASVVINITFKTLFLLFLIFADKKLHWFVDVQRDDVVLWNAKHNA